MKYDISDALTIVHVFNTEKEAYCAFWDEVRVHEESIDYITRIPHKMYMSCGVVHIFMGADVYYKWCKGKTYILNEKIYHSGYELLGKSHFNINIAILLISKLKMDWRCK